jgi:hypothetical protein
MTHLRNLVLEHFTAEYVLNPYPAGELPCALFQTVRNAVVRTCRRHGPTGPMGEFHFEKDTDDLFEAWEPGDDEPVYWVVDDQYNDDQYLYLEFQDPVGFSPKWLEDITATLRQYPGWGIGVQSLTEGYLLIFADRLLVKGPGFQGCRNAAEVVEAVRKQIR